MEMSKKKSSCVRGPEKAEGARLGAGRRNLELRFTGIVNGSIELISARGREDGSARCRGMGTVNAAVLSAISAGGRDFDRFTSIHLSGLWKYKSSRSKMPAGFMPTETYSVQSSRS